LNDVQVLDDLIPKALSDEIESLLLGRHFPWYFMPDITHVDSTTNLNPAFSHSFSYYDAQTKTCVQNSDFYGLIKNIYYSVITTQKYFSDYKISCCRSFFQLPVAVSTKNKKHIDFEEPHRVCLYYVNDADGDTFIYGKSETDPITRSVTPKKGRVVLFDGAIYHCSSKPTLGSRAIINFNLVQ
jgi:hypothetical protein